MTLKNKMLTTTEKENLADKYLVKMMQKEPMKIISWMLIQLGIEMVSSNAATIDIKQEFDIKSKRYQVECNSKIIEVDKLK